MTKREKCERRAIIPDEWICDRCGSFWWDTLVGPDWRPLSCPEKKAVEPSSQMRPERRSLDLKTEET